MAYAVYGIFPKPCSHRVRVGMYKQDSESRGSNWVDAFFVCGGGRPLNNRKLDMDTITARNLFESLTKKCAYWNPNKYCIPDTDRIASMTDPTVMASHNFLFS